MIPIIPIYILPNIEISMFKDEKEISSMTGIHFWFEVYKSIFTRHAYCIMHMNVENLQ